MNRRAVTLVEIMISLLIVAFIAAAVFTAYPVIFRGSAVASARVLAWEEARRQMDTLKKMPFGSVVGGPNCGSPPPTLMDVARCTGRASFTTPSLEAGRGVYYVTRMRDADNNLVTDLLEIQVVVCFRAHGRLIGEDADLDGVLDAGEDTPPADGRISSPVTLVTLVMS